MSNNIIIHPFPWKGCCHGQGTFIKLTDEFINTHTGYNTDKPLFNRAVYAGSIGGDYNEPKYRFEKAFKSTVPGIMEEEYGGYDRQALNLKNLDFKYFNEECAQSFIVTEKELDDMIEKIYLDFPVERKTAQKPVSARNDMRSDYKGKQEFFKLNGKWYGKGTEIYIKEDFIYKHEKLKGKTLTKKVKFHWSEVLHGESERKYRICTCSSMEDTNNEYDYEGIIYLTLEDFYEAIDFISTPYAIKGKDWEDPGLFIVLILCILLCVISTMIFTNSSIVWVMMFFLFIKLRRTTLFK